jgi:DNA-binding SARP family transcriptional activator
VVVRPPTLLRPVGAPEATGVRVALLDAFAVTCDGAPVQLPLSVQRLVAFVALHRHPVLRPYVAGSLWPDTSDERAFASLRSVLWRLHRTGLGVIEAVDQQLRLGADVEVDLRAAETLARRALDDDRAEGLDLDPSLLARDLLPDWYDDWVLIEREFFRQFRLRALDASCERLIRAGRLREALEAGLSSVAGEPLRESAHRALIRVHLAEGNAGEAIRQYRFCRRLLRERLGIEPSDRTKELIREVDDSETFELIDHRGTTP